MSADEEMRHLLDERGVEYMLDQRYRELFWDFGESGRARASAIGTKGLVQMIVTGLTPEQAVEATLGPKVCHMSYNELSNTSMCLVCGWRMDGKPNYCPSCGAKVVGE